MTEFCTYTTNADTDPVALTRQEYEDQGLPDDWSDYIWQEAENKDAAKAMHEQRLNEFMAEQAGMTVKDYIQNS